MGGRGNWKRPEVIVLREGIECDTWLEALEHNFILTLDPFPIGVVDDRPAARRALNCAAASWVQSPAAV